jgi:uncharacterized membrane protein YccF (DUF307 family)
MINTEMVIGTTTVIMVGTIVIATTAGQWFMSLHTITAGITIVITIIAITITVTHIEATKLQPVCDYS